MDRVTRHLVFQTPQAAQRHDFGDALPGGALAEHRADSSYDVFGSTQRSGQRLENGYGWKTRSKSPSCFLDGGKDVWTPSPDRESRLEMVRSGSLYDLRAYRGERKPSKLYDEDEEDRHRVPPPNISPEKARELEDQRREIIRSQVVRKSSTTAERWSSLDELSSINTGEGQHAGGGTTSFAVCFDKPSAGRAATPVDPENIDTDQINFSAARQQFLMLEKTNPGSFFSPGQQGTSPKPESTTRVSRQEWPSPEMAAKAARGYGNAGAPNQSRMDKSVYQVYSVSYKTPGKEEVYAPRRADAERPCPTGRMSGLAKASSREDLDSGFGEMYTEGNASYTSGEIFNGFVDLREGSNGLDKETKTSNETPIEREIRLAMEREENLWKERGIQRLTSSSELVEIQTKPLLSMRTSPGPGRKGKDKGRASLYLQREIEQETKREEDLKKQGRLLGTYDKGPQQELDERRRVFEQEEAPPQQPVPPQQPTAPRKAEERQSWVSELVVEQPWSRSPQPPEDTRGGRSGHTASVAHFQASQPRFAAGERSREQPLGSPRASASASKWGSEDAWGGRIPSSSPRPAGAAVLPRAYFSLPFWKPKFSLVDEMGTRSPLRREDGREEQYRLRTWKPQTSSLIEEEIRSDLLREEELQEQRRRRQLIDGGSLVLIEGCPQEGSRSRHSSAASGVSGTYSVSESPVSSPAPRQTGILGLISSFTPLRVAAPSPGSSDTPDPARSSPFEERRRRVKEDGKVVESTRVTRHKSAMAQRWEAGQYVRDDD
ncbi:mitotic interactor and substrate of PLK1 isoform 2-T3 [Pterocles gutturalis]